MSDELHYSTTKRRTEKAETLPSVRQSNIAALAIADIHLSHHQPTARAEEDWYEAMESSLMQVRQLSEEWRCPVICAGDVFPLLECSSPTN